MKSWNSLIIHRRATSPRLVLLAREVIEYHRKDREELELELEQLSSLVALHCVCSNL
jgi:hypothetical protein